MRFAWWQKPTTAADLRATKFRAQRDNLYRKARAYVDAGRRLSERLGPIPQDWPEARKERWREAFIAAHEAEHELEVALASLFYRNLFGEDDE